MFREEKLPVATQSPPGEKRFTELLEVQTEDSWTDLSWEDRDMSPECNHDLGAHDGGQIVGIDSEGVIAWEAPAGSGDMIHEAIVVMRRHGWQLDSEWTDSIGRHARMVTTQPRGE